MRPADYVDWLFFAWYVWLNHLQAHWLPWWRRYLPSPFMLLTAVLAYREHPVVDIGSFYIAIALFLWNWHTSNRNKRDNRDLKSAEVAEQRLTEVQETAFRREAIEAT